MQPSEQTSCGPVLVSAGLLLAQDDFQMLLDADNTSKGADVMFHAFTLTLQSIFLLEPPCLRH